jgi:hypothetical protein
MAVLAGLSSVCTANAACSLHRARIRVGYETRCNQSQCNETWLACGVPLASGMQHVNRAVQHLSAEQLGGTQLGRTLGSGVLWIQPVAPAAKGERTGKSRSYS